jgi:hypothetical protein
MHDSFAVTDQRLPVDGGNRPLLLVAQRRIPAGVPKDQHAAHAQPGDSDDDGCKHALHRL